MAGHDGRNVRQLTTDDGVESSPVFSPDGKQLAFSAQYDGNTDVFTVPVTGGAPVRLTWHPGADIAQAFTPDGKCLVDAGGAPQAEYEAALGAGPVTFALACAGPGVA